MGIASDTDLNGIAASSKIVLDGKTPGEAHPALHNNRVKHRILHAQKREKAPYGLGIAGKHLRVSVRIY